MSVKRFYLILILLTITGWLVILAEHMLFSGNESNRETLCLIKAVSGYPCPACGTGRGIVSLTTFHFRDALWYNPFSLLVAFSGIIIPIWILIDLKRKKVSLFDFNVRLGLWLKNKPFVLVFLIALVMANWVWNFFKYSNV